MDFISAVSWAQWLFRKTNQNAPGFTAEWSILSLKNQTGNQGKARE